MIVTPFSKFESSLIIYGYPLPLYRCYHHSSHPHIYLFRKVRNAMDFYGVSDTSFCWQHVTKCGADEVPQVTGQSSEHFKSKLEYFLNQCPSLKCSSLYSPKGFVLFVSGLFRWFESRYLKALVTRDCVSTLSFQINLCHTEECEGDLLAGIMANSALVNILVSRLCGSLTSALDFL